VPPPPPGPKTKKEPRPNRVKSKGERGWVGALGVYPIPSLIPLP